MLFQFCSACLAEICSIKAQQNFQDDYAAQRTWHFQPKLLHPALLSPAERIAAGGLRVFLLSDGKSSSQSCGELSQNLLPAEGAIFLTNYRVIFKGQPCDPFCMFFTFAYGSISNDRFLLISHRILLVLLYG